MTEETKNTQEDNGINESSVQKSIVQLRPHSFELAKQHIQTFSSKTSSNLGLEKVSIAGGLFNLGDHKVTGSELNNITSQVQEYLIKFNELHTEFINEFGQVYAALESLDSEYIPAILSSALAAEEASNQAKAANVDIQKTINDQKKMVEVLKKHKEKLDKFKHLENIDELWTDMSKCKKELEAYETKLDVLKKQIGNEENKIADIEKKICNILDFIKKDEKVIKSLQDFVDEVGKIEHLSEIDRIWSDVGNAKKELESLIEASDLCQNEIKNLEQRLDTLTEFESSMKEQTHLYDVDYIYESVNVNRENIDSLINANKSLSDDILDLRDILKNEHEENQTKISGLRIKLTYAYIVAGGAVGIGVIEIILSILGIV